MSFRRIPFQFSTTDPVERQRELEKRFGLPAQNKMTVDNPNLISMGPTMRDTVTAAGSPRLQHRVPIFVEGYDYPVKSSVDSVNSSSENKKSNVRVIPIEVEGAETGSSGRQRTFSGPAGVPKEESENVPRQADTSPLKRSMQDLTKPHKAKATAGPKVYNIPIQVEGAGMGKTAKLKNSKPQVKKDSPKVNGCEVSKQKDVKANEQCASELSKEKNITSCVENSFKKIDNVLEELKSYECGVQEFTGTAKDKQYRYLDEMLTRCMLRLDDIDTMGDEKLRSTRKNAVKKVQACIDLLETKITNSSVVSSDSAAENAVNNGDSNQVLTIAESNVVGTVERGEISDVEMVESQSAENNFPYEKLEKNGVNDESSDRSQKTETQANKCLNVETSDKSNEGTEVEIVASCEETSLEGQVKEIEMTESSQEFDLKPDNDNKEPKALCQDICQVNKDYIQVASEDSNIKEHINEVNMSEGPNMMDSPSTNVEHSEENQATSMDNSCNDAEVSDVEMTEIQNDTKEEVISETSLMKNVSENNIKVKPKDSSAEMTECSVQAQSTVQDCSNVTSSQKDIDSNECDSKTDS